MKGMSMSVEKIGLDAVKWKLKEMRKNGKKEIDVPVITSEDIEQKLD